MAQAQSRGLEGRRGSHQQFLEELVQGGWGKQGSLLQGAWKLKGPQQEGWASGFQLLESQEEGLLPHYAGPQPGT